MEYLKNNNELEVDFFGKGTRYIKDKWDGIAPYKYTIAIKNVDIPYYIGLRK